MSGSPFPIDEYLQRIGAPTRDAVGLERLEELQRAQSCSLPFENFDIVLGRGIRLEPDRLIDKLLRSHRGGYCFELNGLFLRALQHLGFDARALLARVIVGGEPSGRTHQLSLLELGGRQWIADVGFGGMCPRVPMALAYEQESDHDGTTYRLRAHELGYLLQCRLADSWIDLYCFDLSPVVQNDILVANHFTATHPSSFFTTARIASIAHPRGRHVLLDTRCTSICDGTETTESFPDGPTYLTRLRERFGIELDTDYADLAPLPDRS